MVKSWKKFSMFLAAGVAAISLFGAEAEAAAVLTHRYSFSNGTTDSVGGPAWNGTLVNGATVSGGALQLANIGGSGGTVEYMSMPANILPTTSTTIEEWFTSNASSNWARGFDFGSGPGVNFFFTPVSGSADSRVRVNDGGGETGPTGAMTLNNNTEYMIAAVVDGTNNLISYYINGNLYGSTALAPNTLAGVNDVANYLGRSQYGDPGLIGSIDEFRIYDGVLSSADIARDFALGPNTLVPEPSSLAAMGGLGAMGLFLVVRRRHRGLRNTNRG